MPFASTMTQTPQAARATDLSSGGRIVTADGKALPLRATEIRADASAGLARVILRQTFVNDHAEPLRVTYQVPLPSDAAVSGYAFELRDRRIVGEVDRTSRARERFEEAIMEGRSAALLEQDRSSLFTQEIGNVPPGEEIVTELSIDQKLRWDSEGAWEWRFPTVVAPRYMGAAGRVADAAKVSVDVADGPLPLRASLSLHVRDTIAGGGTPESPSHPVVSRAGIGGTEISFRSEDGARLDRDVVVRWRVATLEPGTRLDVARPADGEHAASAFGLLTLVPPSPSAGMEPVARDLIVLLDTSGSMHGEPIEQAKRVTLALIDSLSDRDSLELIEFSNRPNRWQRKAVSATARNKALAAAWVRKIQAGGGTEMRSGIVEALRPLRKDAQRQIILATDGLIGFDNEIVAEVMSRLPKGSRVHTLGIGSGVNRSLTGPVARAGAGVEMVVGVDEDPERAAARLVRATDAPLVVDLEIEGSAVRARAQHRLPDLMAGAPAMLLVELNPEGGELRVSGRLAEGGRWQQQLRVEPAAHGTGSPAVTTLFGREQVEDLEMQRAAGEHGLDQLVEKIGLTFQIATRLTSWVAVSSVRTVDPGALTRNERMPHELPYGMSVERLGLRGAGMPPGALGLSTNLAAAPMGPPQAAAFAPMRVGPPRSRRASSAIAGIARGIGDFFKSGGGDWERDELHAEPEPLPADMEEPMPPEDERATYTQTGELQGGPELVPGRITIQKDDLLVLELTPERTLRWEAGEEVVLYLEDGNQVIARVDATRTTRSGPVAAGTTLRLVLTLSAPLASPVQSLSLDGDRILVSL